MTNHNAPVIMVSIEKTELLDGLIDYDVFCWRNSSDSFHYAKYRDENEAMADALRIGVPVVRWMGWATRNQWIDRIERGMTA